MGIRCSRLGDGWRRAFLVCVLAGLLAPGGALAATEPTLTVTVVEGDSLRSLARRYLNDPNLWHEILRTSGLSSPADVEPGMKLRIPRTEISLATTALESARSAQQKATAAGARVFAATTIEASLSAWREALELRRGGRWPDCTERARAAERLAERAYEETMTARDAAVEAVLRSRVGRADGRQPRELDWSERSAGDRLIEQERLRTLSDSQAVIVFADESRLRLGPNSQAVIQKMRLDRLDHRQEASVSLERGEVFGLLDSTGARNAFEVKAPGVTTDSVSSDFWIGQEGEETKIANYDRRGMRVTSAGGTVRLLQNQGTVVETGEAPSAPRDLLPAPALSAPEEGASVVAQDAVLAWRQVGGAVAYNVVVAADPSAKDVVTTAVIEDRSLDVGELEDGVYYWAVSAVDGLGLPGPASHIRRFRITRPVRPAYLAVSAPQDGVVARTPEVEIRGVAQVGAELTVDGEPVELAADGAFVVGRRLQEGSNTFELTLRGRDGSRATRTVAVDFRPDAPVAVRWADALARLEPDGAFLTRFGRWQGHGMAEPGARIAVLDAAGRRLAEALADESGQLAVAVPVPSGRSSLEVIATARSGQQTIHGLTVVADRHSPSLQLDGPLPDRTRDSVLRITGAVDDPAVPGVGSSEVRVTVDGRAVQVTEGRFAADVSLAEGSQELEVVAVDAAGNRSVRRHVVRVDRTPPEIERLAIVEGTSGSRSVLEVEVTASDASPLRSSAWLEVVGAGGTVRVPLSRDRASGVYRGHVVGGEPGQLRRVVLEDAVGNRRVAPIGRPQQ